MTEHTPGPWRYGDHDDGNFRIYGPVGMNTAGPVAQAMHRREEGVRAANARLIAAAPETAAERDRLREINAELLEALKYGRGIVRNRLNRSIAECRFLDMCDDAITKAEFNE